MEENNMVFEKVSIVKGRKYKSLVEGYRDENGIVRHRVIKYLGAVEPVQKKKNFNVGKKPTLKVRELSQEEKIFVEKSIKHSESFVKDRAKIIELSSQGNSVKQICEKLKFDKKKVGEIINGFNKFGLKIFERRKNTGRPRMITKEQRAMILQWLNTHPEKLELHFNNCSHNKLSDYAKAQGVIVSSSQAGRIIKQDEIKYKKKIAHLYSDDPLFAKKNF